MSAKQNESHPKKHRLHALCPYFAMFPESFARQSILSTTKFGDTVLDPFSGRGTTVLEALLNGREALACDINPVAAVVSRAKAEAPSLQAICTRLDELESAYRRCGKIRIESAASSLPPFFQHAFTPNTLIQILFLRSKLQYGRRQVDRFIAALVLGHLHGELNRSPNYLSNQMPHSIAPKPGYAIKYWRERGMTPPERDAFALLRGRAAFRLQHGVPSERGVVRQIDVRHAAKTFQSFKGKVAAVITSPPYLDVTSFEEDQWLRLWFLGGSPHPTYNVVSQDDRHTNREQYFTFLTEAWKGIAPLLRRRATITCRIGTRKISAKELTVGLDNSIHAVWPKAIRVLEPSVSELRNRQTETFRPGSKGCQVEYDYRYVTMA